MEQYLSLQVEERFKLPLCSINHINLLLMKVPLCMFNIVVITVLFVLLGHLTLNPHPLIALDNELNNQMSNRTKSREDGPRSFNTYNTNIFSHFII